MTSDSEISRIRKVYRGYLEDASAQKRWEQSTAFKQHARSERIAAMRALLGEIGMKELGGKKVLEVGCYQGGFMKELLELGIAGKDLQGVDLLEDEIEKAKILYPEIRFTVANAERCPFPDQSFDMVVQSTAFSSILDHEMAKNVAAEMMRMVKPDGCILWYDLRQPNPWNLNVRGIGKSEVQSLFPGFEMICKTITVNPRLGQLVPNISEATYKTLASLPVLRTHLLAVFTPAQPTLQSPPRP